MAFPFRQDVPGWEGAPQQSDQNYYSSRKPAHLSNRRTPPALQNPPTMAYDHPHRASYSSRDNYYGDFSYADYADEGNAGHEQWPLPAQPRPRPRQAPPRDYDDQRPPARRHQPPAMQNSLRTAPRHPAERHNQPLASGGWVEDNYRVPPRNTRPPHAMQLQRPPQRRPNEPNNSQRLPMRPPRPVQGQASYFPEIVRDASLPTQPPTRRSGKESRFHDAHVPATDDIEYLHPSVSQPIDPMALPASPSEYGMSGTASYTSDGEAHEGFSDLGTPEPTILRQASLGKKTKPTLTTVKHAEKARQSSFSLADSPTIVPDQDTLDLNRKDSDTVPVGGAFAAPSEPTPFFTPSSFITPQPARGPMSGHSTSSEALPGDRPRVVDDSSVELPETLPEKTRENAIAAQHEHSLDEKTGAFSFPVLVQDDEHGIEDRHSFQSPPVGFSSTRTPRLPLRIDVDAVRDAEARGSLTSLPDLIRRATKVASNLDRGKTASRLGLDWFLNTDSAGKRVSTNGSVNDMLESFPPPMAQSGDNRRSLGHLSSHLRHSVLLSDSDGEQAEIPRPRRSCCGMPLWAFWLVLVVLLILIAAAVVVPVMLLVVEPHKRSG